MKDTGLAALPSETVDQAIEWSIRMVHNRPDTATQLAFERWLACDESHRLAWSRLQSLGGRFAGMPAGMARQALDRLPEARLQRRQMMRLLALFAAVGTTAWNTRDTLSWQRLMADYSTGLGEHRQWTLDDGSLLELNTDSAVRLRFDEDERVIELLRGELYLASGTDPDNPLHRPLRVTSTFGLFEALGTCFSVREDSDGCRLGVTEGAVRMQPRAGEGDIAQAGETWQLTRDSVWRLSGSAQDAQAWRDGLLIARAMPLAELLGELGRYRPGYLGCDPEIARRSISGNFNLDDTDATLRFIAQAHGLHLHGMTRYWVRLSA
ncbi:FecR family protein [Pseudomonas sp. RC3H12]|uniref:FecR domain-containing protein n=1 Tax=Pseudomonas sp. RC3H12 TaxID=2834406 RepID=UPI001BDECA21|nr:FecR family protein [Pseudomonas sp. RC3H12]QWA31397.1 FecR family protein [Pseudomonas sp. RC3H12]